MASSSRVKSSGSKIVSRSDFRAEAARAELVVELDTTEGVRRSRRIAAQRTSTAAGEAQTVAGPNARGSERVTVASPLAFLSPTQNQPAQRSSGAGPVRDETQGNEEVLGLRAVRVVLDRCDRQVNQPAVAERGIVQIAEPPQYPAIIAAAPGGNRFTDVRILQLNMRRSTVVTGEVRKLVDEKRLDVLLLQEPYVRKQGRSHTFYGLGTGMRVAAVRAQRPWAAVAVCNPAFQMTFVSQLSTTHCVCVEVLAPSFSFYVVSHYFQWSDDIEEHLRHLATVLRSLRGQRVLVSLDANARSSLWGPQETNRRGAQLEELIREFGLHVVNDINQSPTYWTERGSSYIDVTLSSPSMTRFIGNWTVRDDWTTSDHNALDIRLRVPKAAVHDGLPETSRFNVKRADWDRFTQTLTELSGTRLEGLPLTSTLEVETMARTLTGVLTDACTESMPRRKHFRKSNPWWTVALTNLKKGVYRKRRAFQEERAGPRRHELRLQYRTSLREYSREVKRTKLESWRSFVTSHGNAKPWGYVYKQQADKLRVEKVLSTIRRNDGFTMDMRETASCLLDTHVPDDQEHNDTPQQRELRESAFIAPETPDDPLFTRAELAVAVKSLKNDKAPGPDLIEVAVLKTAFAVIPDQLLRLFNGCLQWGTFPSAWKEGSLRVLLKGEDKDERDPKSYRPICLLSVVGKLFEKLLKGRLARSAMAPGKISARQFGFVSGKSTEDAIVELRRMVRDSEETYAVALLFDISGAFDNVWWPLVLNSLKDRDCPKNVFEVLRSYFANRNVKITWGNEEVSKRATRGCPQGSVLGPACWNLMFDGLLRVLEELVPNNFVAYADDLLVLVEGNSRREIEQRAQRVVDRIVEWCSSAKLQLSERKTEAILLQSNWIRREPVGRRGGDRPDRVRRAGRRPNMANRYPVIRIGNTRIAFKDSVRYLGVHFDKEMGVRTHCLYLREKVAGLFSNLGKLSGSGWGLRYRVLHSVYRGVFNPTVAYAAAGWSDLCREADLRILRTAQRLALIAVTSAYRTTSYAALCVIAGALPVQILLEQSRARYDIRVGWDARINNVAISANAADAVERIKDEAVNMWQVDWNSTSKGRTTFAFFESIRERIAAGWLRPDYYSTQVLSGHGDFGARLASLGLVDGVDCACGLPDTVGHFLLECPTYEPQRVALREYVGDGELPAVAHQLVSSAEAFSVLSDFCRECLWLKAHEQVDIGLEGDA